MARPIPDLFYLVANSVGRAAAGVTIKPGLGDRWRHDIESYVLKNGKFSKFETAYSPISPPPVFWEYNCGQCFAFQRATLTCKWVSEQGLVNPGKISPVGWCAIWMPMPGVKPFTYVGKLPWFLRERLPVFP